MSTPDLAALVASMPFAAALGITVDEVTPDRVRAMMTWAEERCTTGGIMHGGAVTATCMPLHVGRSTIVVQSNLTDDRGKMVAQVTQTQAVHAAPGIDAAAK